MALSSSHLQTSPVDSTTNLFSRLGLVGPNTKKMDYMDIDQVMEIPDTPDRLASQQKVTFAVSDDVVNSSLLTRGIHHGPRGCHRVNASNSNNKKLLSHHKRDLDIHGEINNGISLFDSASNNASVTNENWSSKKNETSLIKETHITEPAPRHKKFTLHMPSIPRGSTNHPVERAKLRIGSDSGELASDMKIQGGNRRKIIDSSQNALDNGFLRGTVNDTKQMVHLDLPSSNAETDISTDIPRSFICQEVDYASDISKQPKNTGKLDRPCSTGGLRKAEDRDLTVGSVSGLIQQSRSQSQLPTTDDPFNNVDSFSRASSHDCKREGIPHGAGESMSNQNVNGGLAGDVKGKGIDLCIVSPQNSGQSASNAMPSRRPGQRKLVRNGCISPFNIAKSKITSENIGKNIKDDKQDKNAKMTFSNLSDGSSSCPIHITSSTSEVKRVDRGKGKAIIDANVPENCHNIRPTPLSCGEEDFGSGGTCDIFKSAEETGGWRSTHHSSKIANSSSSHDINIHSSSELFHHNHRSRRETSAFMTAAKFPETASCRDGNPIIIHDSGSSMPQTQAPSSNIFEPNAENRSQKGKQKIVKRPRKGMTSCNDTVGSACSLPNDPEVSFLQSSGQSATIKRNITVKSQPPSNLVPIVEINEPCTSRSGFTESQNSDSIFGDNSDSRARQVEADEILARQLQEQFYSEVPGIGSAEVDASLAWALQHEEDADHSSFLGSRRLSNARESAGRHSYRGYPTSHIPSNRPTTTSRGYTSTRMRQLRRSLHDHSHFSSRGRSLNFPPNMDAETRIDILEALEAAVGNRTNMLMAGRLFQVQRDFNENDYEMLLALDDENHQHVGASLNQINSLPQSIIQTNDFEEACAICLETPSIGDTIRHLPCLHKFHKECIDLWLRRKTSCPICKSSVT